jgi:restriction endonuclease S subunit
MSNYTQYFCKITGKTFDQKSHIDKHLKTKTFKQQLKIKKLELEKLSKDELKTEYGSTNIESILDNLSCVKIKNEYELIKQNKDGSIYYQLDEKDKENKKIESTFKNDFKNKLKKWHNMLSGCGVTGDPAFDDIINILLICYLVPLISETGKYDFSNLDKYPATKKKKITKYLEVFNIDYIKNNTKKLTKSMDNNDGKSIFSKIGVILSNHPLTKSMFPSEDFINCNKDNILSQLITEIYNYSNEKDIFQYQDLVGIAYEFWLNDYQGNSGSELGNYFTERDLMLMTFHLMDEDDIIKYINNNSVIGDEFCGTFGYPLYMKQFLKKKFDIEIKDKNIYGVELGERHSRLSIINAMFSMDNFRHIKRGDSFITNVNEHLDLSIHNVPFGKRISYANTKEHYEEYRESHPDIPEFKDIIPVDVGKCDAPIASQMVIYKTKHIGLCIIKDGQETTGSGKFINYRKYFCNSCNIKKILKIPGGIFSSTGTKTVCLYFVKGEQTKDIEFMELNNDCDTITRLVKVNYNDLKNNDYSWDPNTYMIDEEFAKMMEKSNCEFKKLGDICKIIKGNHTNSKNGKPIGKYPLYYCSILGHLFVNEYDYDGEGIIINKTNGSGKCMIYYHNGKYSVGNTTIHFNSKDTSILTYYIYSYLIHNIKMLEKYYKGSNQKSISNEDLFNIQIPIPSKENQEKCVEQLDLLNMRKQRLEEDNDMINKQMKYYFENQIKKHLDNIEVKKLGDICEFKNGKSITKNKLIDGIYPVIGGGQTPMGYHNNFNRAENTILCSQSGNYSGYISRYINKVWASDCFSIEPNNEVSNKYLYYYLKNQQHNIYKLQSGAGQPHVYSRDLQSYQIPIPVLKKQNENVEYLDNLEKIKESNNTQIEQIKELMKSILEQSYYSNNESSSDEDNIDV